MRLHLSPKTVETHREKVKQKLNLKSSAELNRRAVQWVLERGWPSTTTDEPTQSVSHKSASPSEKELG
jgi:hypothetical protein